MFFENSALNSILPFKVDVAILSAMPEELEYIKTALSKSVVSSPIINGLEFTVYEYNTKTILIGHTGLGTTFAASIVTLTHQYFHPDYMLFCGTAGGINPSLKLCDVIIVENAFEAEIQGVFQLVKNTPFESCLTHPLKQEAFPAIYPANRYLLNIARQLTVSNSTVYQGTVVTSNAFPAPPELFENIKSANPYSIDMETSAVYQIAWLLNIRALAIRGISNLLNSDGTDDAIEQSDVKGSSEAAAKIALKILDTLLIEANSSINARTCAI